MSRNNSAQIYKSFAEITALTYNCEQHAYIIIFIAMTAVVKYSKYPPAEPGALRLLAPQRGLFAIGKNKNQSFNATRSDKYSFGSRSTISGAQVLRALP